jgi:hypothetical protein
MTGRPKTGTGGHSVRLSQSNQSSNRLLIGKELWRAIGSPARVSISRHGRALHIEPTTDTDAGTYTVTGGVLTQPRISIGKDVCREELRLFAPAVYEHVQLRDGVIVVFV